MELIQTEQQNKKRIIKSGDNLRDLKNNSIKQNNIHDRGLRKKSKRQKTYLKK